MFVILFVLYGFGIKLWFLQVFLENSKFKNIFFNFLKVSGGHHSFFFPVTLC